MDKGYQRSVKGHEVSLSSFVLLKMFELRYNGESYIIRGCVDTYGR